MYLESKRIIRWNSRKFSFRSFDSRVKTTTKKVHNPFVQFILIWAFASLASYLTDKCVRYSYSPGICWFFFAFEQVNEKLSSGHKRDDVSIPWLSLYISTRLSDRPNPEGLFECNDKEPPITSHLQATCFILEKHNKKHNGKSDCNWKQQCKIARQPVSSHFESGGRGWLPKLSACVCECVCVELVGIRVAGCTSK